jgi:NADPH:quinone reductase-like Zn-dependent oxidoreductase
VDHPVSLDPDARLGPVRAAPERAAAAGVRSAFVFTPPRGAVLAELARQVDAGRLRAFVGQEFALAEAAQAHRLGEGGRSRGKMVLHVAAPQANWHGE